MAEPVILQAQNLVELTLSASVTAKVGDLIGHDGTNWVLADADARVPAQYVAMEYGAAGARIHACQSGVIYDSDAPYTTGNDQYLSATAGAHTATIPAISTTLTLLQRVGKALTTDSMAFNLVNRGPHTMRVRAAYDPVSLAATTARDDTVTVTGLVSTDVIRGVHVADITGTGWNSGLVIQGMDVSAGDTLRVRLTNPTAGVLDGASVNLDVFAERY